MRYVDLISTVHSSATSLLPATRSLASFAAVRKNCCEGGYKIAQFAAECCCVASYIANVARITTSFSLCAILGHVLHCQIWRATRATTSILGVFIATQFSASLTSEMSIMFESAVT